MGIDRRWRGPRVYWACLARKVCPARKVHFLGKAKARRCSWWWGQSTAGRVGEHRWCVAKQLPDLGVEGGAAAFGVRHGFWLGLVTFFAVPIPARFWYESPLGRRALHISSLGQVKHADFLFSRASSGYWRFCSSGSDTGCEVQMIVSSGRRRRRVLCRSIPSTRGFRPRVCRRCDKCRH